MPQIIPLTSDPDRTFDVELGGNLLTLRTYYNPTVPGWYMDVDGVAKGLALVPFADVFESSPEIQRTIGQMRLIVSDGADVVAEALPQDTSDPLAGVRVWRGSVEPDGAVNGDLWIDTGSTNLFLWSENLGNWSAYTQNVTFGPGDTVMAPDGTMSADTITETTATGEHYVDRYQAYGTTGQFTISAYLFSAAGGRNGLLGMYSTGNNHTAWFNLTTGVATVLTPLSGATAGMINVGGGWWRCWLTATITNAAGPIQRVTMTDASGNNSYTGNGVGAIYTWGRQLNQGPLARYIPTTSSIVSTVGSRLTYKRIGGQWVESTLPSRAPVEARATLGSSAQLWWFSPGEWVSDEEAPALDPVPGAGGYVVA